MDEDMSIDAGSVFGLAPAFQEQPKQQSNNTPRNGGPGRKQLQVIFTILHRFSLQFSDPFLLSVGLNVTETLFSFRTVRAAKALTSHQPRGTSKLSARTSLNQGAFKAQKTYE